MGLKPFPQKSIALTHSKAVLLIHHHQSKSFESDRILKQCVRAHKNLASP